MLMMLKTAILNTLEQSQTIKINEIMITPIIHRKEETCKHTFPLF
jgi:hypothetical protein